MRQKYNITNENPAISRTEMEGYKNFDLLLKKQSKSIANKTQGRLVKRLVLGVLGAVMLYFLFPLSEGEYANIESDKKENAIVTTENIEKKKQEVPSIADDEKGKEEVIAVEKKPPLETKQFKEKIKEENSKEVVNYNYAEASPVDGLRRLYKYFDAELSYPKAVLKDSIEGTVLVSFVVGKEGEIKHIEVLQSLSSALDKEAVRVINNMPAWNAAMVNEEPVESKLSIPLTFNIKNK